MGAKAEVLPHCAAGWGRGAGLDGIPSTYDIVRLIHRFMSNMLLRPDETELRGQWFERGGEVVGDETCQRIKTLTAGVLEKIATDQSGWETLYRDPRDNRLWEHSYPQSGYHGGGPPRLALISPAAAHAKYGSLQA